MRHYLLALCLLLLFTAILTVRQRLRLSAAFGDQGDAKLIAASRSHGNLAEHAPIVVILLGLHLLAQLVDRHLGLARRVHHAARRTDEKYERDEHAAEVFEGQMDTAAHELETALGINLDTARKLIQGGLGDIGMPFGKITARDG